MKIALFISLVIIIIILIILYFQHKPIQTFKNSMCVLTNDELDKLTNQKNDMNTISRLINDIYKIATRLNNNSDEKKTLDIIHSSNTELYNLALEKYNASSIKTKLNSITNDKNIINNYYAIVLNYYNHQNTNCA
jgi:DNA repair ATPase RecN